MRSVLKVFSLVFFRESSIVMSSSLSSISRQECLPAMYFSHVLKTEHEEYVTDDLFREHPWECACEDTLI